MSITFTRLQIRLRITIAKTKKRKPLRWAMRMNIVSVSLDTNIGDDGSFVILMLE